MMKQSIVGTLLVFLILGVLPIRINAQQQQIKAPGATSVEYAQGSSNKIKFVKIADKTWRQGPEAWKLTWREAGLDEWTITLSRTDPSSGAEQKVVLDLQQKQVLMYTQPGYAPTGFSITNVEGTAGGGTSNAGSAPAQNVALGKPARQSSTAFGAEASRAVDGNTNGLWSLKSVTHAILNQPDPWWEVDLGALYDVSEIKLFKRTDCCTELLDNYRIQYSDQPITANSAEYVGYQRGSTVNPVSFKKDAKNVRYIRVSVKGNTPFYLAEVQVMGVPSNGTTATTTTQNCSLSDWAGEWNTTFNLLSWNAQGDGSLVGTFNTEKHNIQARPVNGNPCVVEGTYAHSNGPSKGRVRFTMDPDKRSFKGAWSAPTNEPTGTNWTGTKKTPAVATATPVVTATPVATTSTTQSCSLSDWAGVWNTNYNPIDWTVQSDGSLSGTYNTTQNHVIQARPVAGNPCVVEGRWEHRGGTDKGRIRFTMDPSKNSFKGVWSNGNAEPTGNWSGTLKTRAVATTTPVATPTPGTSTTRTNTRSVSSGEVNGQNVTKVEFQNAGNKNIRIGKANYRNIEDKVWNLTELDQQGRPVGPVTNCSETGRDQWSVYLSCQGVATHIDLFKKTVSTAGGGGPVTYFEDQLLVEQQANADKGASSFRRAPLSPADLEKVMMWIAKETVLARTPYCDKDRYTNPRSTPMNCQAGYTQESLGLCTKNCQSNERGIGTFCYSNCPAGFRDDGLYCGKPNEYERESFPWKPGDPPLPNYTGPTTRCEAKYGKGNCQRDGAIIYPKCNAGFNPTRGNYCSPVCPSGFSDIGVSCKKPTTSTRQVVPVSNCQAGTYPGVGLCYPNCKAGYDGKGPVCWQNCSNSRLRLECGGIGCAANESECAQVIADRVLAPINFLTSVLSLGLQAKIDAKVAARAAIIKQNTLGLSTAQATKIAEKALKLEALGPKLFKITEALEKVETIVENGQKVADTAIAIQELVEEVESFADEYESSFENITSFSVNRKINEEFGGYRSGAAIYIKREWARRHLLAAIEGQKWRVAEQVIDIVLDTIDIVGIKALVDAFNKPKCAELSENPFPTVKRLY